MSVKADRDTPCFDCGRGGEHYMIRDEVWAEALAAYTEHAPYTEEPGFLCLGCLGTRIGRTLWPRDFKAVPCNRWLLAA